MQTKFNAKRKSFVAHTGQLPWPTNVWMGVSVDSADARYRVADLRQCRRPPPR